MKNSPNTIKIERLVRFSSYAIGILGFISIFRNIDITYSALFASLFALSIYFDIRQKNPLPRWSLNIFSFVFVAAAIMRFTMDDPVKPLVETLLILLVIKFLEKKLIRDYIQIYLISVLLLAGSALLSLNIEFAIYLLIMMFLLSIAIVSLTYYSEDNDLILKADAIKSLILKSTIIPIMAVPITIILFLILPRTSYPLLNFLNRSTAVTGFSDSVTLGGISDIQIDETIIMRVKMKPIPQEKLYWRGIVLDFFDGISWRNSGSKILRLSYPPEIKGEKISYTVYLEPYYNKYLFFLDKPNIKYPFKITALDDLTFMHPESITQRIRYNGVSVISEVLPERDINKDKYLQLPKTKFENIAAKVNEITENKDEKSSAEAIMKFLKYGDYKYSLKNLPITGKPLDDFLFTYKYGNCEYFASAMTLMLRMRGIPARIVGGYIGGYYNEMGKYYAIPQKNAHVWVEAYFDKKGWVRFDPTPSAGTDFLTLRGGFIKLRIILDTLNFHWNAFIINYDFTRQMRIFNKIRLNIQQPKIAFAYAKGRAMHILPYLVPISLIIVLVYLFILKRKTYEERIMAQFLGKMRKLGYEKNKTEGLEEFANKIEADEVRAKALTFVQTFESHFYRDKKLTRQDYQRFRAMLKDYKGAERKS